MEYTDSMIDICSPSETESGYLDDTCYESADVYYATNVNYEYLPKQNHVETYNGISRSSGQKPQNKFSSADLLSGIDMDNMSHDLQQAFRILSELLTDSNKQTVWPFLEKIDPAATKAYDYYDKIKKPMWIKKMLEKFRLQQYRSITEFISDMHLMIENCYRYNGPDHPISKKAMKLEVILEQKLVLLPRDIQEKARAAVFRGREKADSSNALSGTRSRRLQTAYNSNWLVNQIRSEQRDRQRDQRRQQMQERKQVQETVSLELDAWEESLLTSHFRQQLNAMWELPQIGLFLFLCSGALNIGELVYWELERCMLLPRESVTLQRVMTSLLSTPLQRERIGGEGKSLMPYEIWEEKLRKRLTQWYKVLHDCANSVEKCCQKIGIDDRFFKVLGNYNPLVGRKFHELSFYQRICTLKALCEYCVDTQEYLRNTIEIQPPEDQREYILGCDVDGFTYLHFPQFCGADLRIYKQAKIELPTLDKKPCTQRKSASRSKNIKRKPATSRAKVTLAKRARQGKTQKSSGESDGEESGEATDGGENNDSDEEESSTKAEMKNKYAEKTKDTNVRGKKSKQTDQNEDVVDSLFSFPSGRKTRTSLRAKMLELMVWDDNQPVPENEQKDSVAKDSEKKIPAKRGRKPKINKNVENDMTVCEQHTVKNEAEDSQIIADAIKSEAFMSSEVQPVIKEREDADEIENKEVLNDSKRDKLCSQECTDRSEMMTVIEKRTSISGIDHVEDRSKNLDIKNDDKNMNDDNSGVKTEEVLSNGDASAEIATAAVLEPMPLPDVSPELGIFELVADSVEGLRQLIAKFSEKIGACTEKKSRKTQEQSSCEKELLEKLEYLLQELDPWEVKLQQCNKRAKLKMMKEMKSYEEECRRKEISKTIWESDESDAESVDNDTGGSDYEPSTDGDYNTRRSSRRNVANRSVGQLSQDANNDLEAGLGISSWGRLRKRRIIPNNIEDQGICSKKLRRSDADVRYDSPSLRSYSPSFRSNTDKQDEFYESYQASSEPKVHSNAVNTLAAKYGTLRSTIFNNGTVNSTSCSSQVTSVAQNSTCHVKVSLDQLQQMGISRKPGTDKLYINPDSQNESTNIAGQQIKAVTRSPAVSNNQQSQQFSLPVSVVRQLIARSQRPQFVQSNVTTKSQVPMSTATLRACFGEKSNPLLMEQAVDRKSDLSMPASNTGLKVIMPVSSSPSTPSSAIRMILPNGQNIVVKQVLNKNSSNSMAPRLASNNNQLRFNSLDAKGVTANANKTTVTISNNVSNHKPSLVAKAAAFQPLANLPFSSSSTQNVHQTLPNKLYDEASNHLAASQILDDINYSRFNSNSCAVSIDNNMPLTALSPIKIVQDKVSPQDVVDPLSFLNSAIGSKSALNSQTVMTTLAKGNINSTSLAVMPTLQSTKTAADQSLQTTQVNVLNQAQFINTQLISTSSKVVQQMNSTQLQQLKAVQLQDGSGRIMLVTPQQFQKAVEVARKNAAIDSAIRKAITTAVNTTLPTAQIRVSSALSPLDPHVRQPHRPVTVVTSATKTPLAAVPQALCRIGEKISPSKNTSNEIVSAGSASTVLTTEDCQDDMTEQYQILQCIDGKQGQTVYVERAVGGGKATVEKISLTNSKLQLSEQVNVASQTRLLDTMSKFATDPSSKSLTTVASNLIGMPRVATNAQILLQQGNSNGSPVVLQQGTTGKAPMVIQQNANMPLVLQQGSGKPMVLQQSNNVVLGQNLLVNGQQLVLPQQQQMIFLTGNSGVLPTVLPVMLGSSVVGMPVAANPSISLIQNSGIQQAAVELNSSLQTNQQMPSMVVTNQLASSVSAINVCMSSPSKTAIISPQKQKSPSINIANCVVQNDISSTQIVGTKANSPGQQRFVLLNVGGQLLAAPTSQLLSNVSMPSANNN